MKCNSRNSNQSARTPGDQKLQEALNLKQAWLKWLPKGDHVTYGSYGTIRTQQANSLANMKDLESQSRAKQEADVRMVSLIVSDIYIYILIIASYVWIPVRSCKSVIHAGFGWQKSRWLMQCKLMLPDFCSHLKCGDCLEYVGMIRLLCKSMSKLSGITRNCSILYQTCCISEARAESMAKGRRCSRSEDQGPQLTVKKKVGLNDFNVLWVYFDPTQKRLTSLKSLLRQELTSPGLGV